jgi:hypothetical protein
MRKPGPPLPSRVASPLKRLALASVGLLCLAAALAAEIPCEWSGVDRIVAVGDIHGAYESLVQIMRGTGVIDEMNHWIGGRTHFVQNGDIMDRGPRARDIFDLLRALDKEAKAAGGMVHVLLGNHEEMNITGIALGYEDYVTIEQFHAFLPPAFRAAKEKEFLKSLKDEPDLRPQDRSLDIVNNPRLRLFWQQLMKDKGPLGQEARTHYFLFFNENYGDWLIRQNTVIRINDVIFVHGGINEEYSTWKLVDINNLMRKELEFYRGRLTGVYLGEADFRPRLVYSPDGPLWYRDLARTDERAALPMVIRILDNLKARTMVIAHTFWRGRSGSPVVTMENMSRFRYPDGNGRIYIIDTGISAVYGGVPSALVFESGRPILWGDPDEELPPRSSPVRAGKAPETQAEAEEFLRTAAILRDRPREESGRSAPRRIYLDDGRNRVGTIFKYIDRRRPQDLPDSWQYEIAAYELSKLLGKEIVPPVVVREIGGVRGSLQVFIEGAIRMSELPKETDPAGPDSPLLKVRICRVFENLVYNSCADPEDTRIRPSDGRVFRVDFAEAFAPVAALLPDCEITCASRAVYEGLLAWDEAKVKDKLGPYLNADELAALTQRKDIILERIRALIKDKGEANVIY